MRAALLGNGYIGGAHRNAYTRLKNENKDIELVAVCDIRPGQLEQANGARTYTDFDKMIECEKDNIDFIDICLPTYLHAEYTIKALRAGFHVLCEKPMALTEEETKRMIDVSKETGKTLMIAQSTRFADEVGYMKKFIEEGSFGKVLNAEFSACGDIYPSWGYNDWFKDGKLSGGVMLDVQAHSIDLINWFFGMPKAVSTVAYECEGATGYSLVSANHIYDGFYVYSYSDWAQNSFHNQRARRVNFENGYIYFNSTFKPAFATVDKDGNVTDLSDKVRRGYDTKANEIEYFVDCIKNNKYPDYCPPEQTAGVIKIMRAQEKSADNNGMPVWLYED